MTAYVVLSLQAPEDAWQIIATVDAARSAIDAIRKAASTTDTVCVAVPARSWKPLTVRVETQTRLVLGETA